MNCFKTILAYTNIQTLFFAKLNIQNFQINQQYHSRQIALETNICSRACQPMNLPIKLANGDFRIMANVRDCFLNR